MSKNNRSDTAWIVAAFAVALAALAGSIWWEWSLWGECRAANSFWYCLRVLS